MKREENIRYFLSCEEWALLLASAGVKSMYGFPFPQDKYSRNQVIGILEGLVRNKMVFSDGSIFHVRQEIEEITGCVRMCRGVICLEDGNREKASVCLYLGESGKLAAAVPVDSRKDFLRLWCMEAEGLAVWMEEAGYLPEAYLPEDCVSKAVWEEESQKILCQMTKRNADDGEAAKVLFLQRGGLHFRLFRQNMSMAEEPWEFYGGKQLQRALEWLMED